MSTEKNQSSSIHTRESFDHLIPLTKEQWTIDKVWLFNRALFLLTLNSRKPDLYWHNDEPPEWSFDDEADLIAGRWPKLWEFACMVMTDHWFESDIGFIEVKNGRT